MSFKQCGTIYLRNSFV